MFPKTDRHGKPVGMAFKFVGGFGFGFPSVELVSIFAPSKFRRK